MEWGAKRRRMGRNDGTARGASSTHMSTELQEVATSSGYDYEVFLSFRGPDTRACFTDFLYTRLNDVGIRTFRDNEELRIGEEFAPELLQAIKQSKILIPIFSKGYASSIWCLKELVKMVECQKNGIQKIMPIFYDVAPSDVRHQIGVYAEAFRSHEKKRRYDKKTIHEWKAALRVAGAIDGWYLHSKTNRREGEFAKEVTQEVLRKLKERYLVVSNYLVSVDNHVDEIMEMIGAQISATRIIGIYGMGGIGKTTIAKIIYNQLSSNFSDCCFLSNICETSKCRGIECLQNQLICDILKTKQTYINNADEGTRIIKEMLSKKRVLLLLDDVEKEGHIDALLGKCDWFDKGSKIIMTTRNKNILAVAKVDLSYEISFMNHDQSLQLLSKHAFRRDSPLVEYMDLCDRAIRIAGGLPLALEVIGSLLAFTSKKKWNSILKLLENTPPMEVLSKLKISYDALDVRQQHIFLDIACLFIGYDKDIVVYFWDESIFFPKKAMDALVNMSLIKIDDNNKVWMHDQLRDLGRQIVRQESNMNIEKQSRVWDPREGSYFMRRPKRNNKVEALRVTFNDQPQYHFTYEDFESLWNLRFLEVNSESGDFCAEERLLWHKSSSNVIPTNENSDLLPQLRWLSWHGIPPTFKITNFSMKDVVILDLSQSKITHNWKGWSHLEVMKILKVLNLTDCHFLERTPNFSVHVNLELLILRGCSKLVEIDGSICQLKRLVSLDVRDCQNLWRLPDEIGGLASLEYLSLDGCKWLERLPNTIQNLELLIKLDISGTSIKELPYSIGNMKNLKVVKMKEIFISKIPDALWMIEKLEEIEAEGLQPFHVNIGNCIYKNQSLRILRLRNAKIWALPRLPGSLMTLELDTLYMTFPDLSNLINLKELKLWFGPCDDDVKSHGPRWICNLSKLESLHLSSVYVTTLPTDISELPQLTSLFLRCANLCYLPRLPSSLLSLDLDNCLSLCSMDLSNLKKLSCLAISSSAISEIRGLDHLENLQNLRFSDLQQVEIVPDMSNLNKLRSLKVRNCSNVVEIQGELPQSLEEFEIFSCESLQKLPDLSSLKGLQKVETKYCSKLTEEEFLGFAWRSKANMWENLQKLELLDLGQVEIVPDLSNLNKLQSLQIRECGNLVEIQGELPQSLEEFKIEFCESLQKLPDLSGLKGLQQVEIVYCSKLNVEAILGLTQRSKANLWENLQILRFSELGQVKILPDLSNLNKLRSLQVQECGNLVEIQGKLPQSLEELEIDYCESLQKLPDLSSLNGLQKVEINCCMKLNLGGILGFA